MPRHDPVPEPSVAAAELYESAFVPAVAIPVSGRLLDLARLRPGERVLDLACGTGIVARLAATRVEALGAVTGVDSSPDMIAVARRSPAAGAAVEWREADAASLPLAADSFDCALCQMGLMLISDPAAALAEVLRVLRPGGRFVASTPGAIQPLFEVLGDALSRHIDANLGGFVRAVFSLHDPDAVAATLRDAGFAGVEAEERTVALDLPGPARFFGDYVGSTPLGYFVAEAPGEVRRALERDVVERWQELVDASGRLALDQPMVYVTGEVGPASSGSGRVDA